MFRQRRAFSPFRRFLIIAAWFPATIATLVLSLQTYSLLNVIRELPGNKSSQVHGISISETPSLAYAALPENSTRITSSVTSGDARPVMIDQYLARYHSPMTGYGDLILEMAEKYGVDPYLFVAIAQQESNLGKKMPSEDCHNAWGYGIHSRGILCFQSWEEGIEMVMKGLSEKYVTHGLDDPQEIMRIYTPFSNGSWAEGVQQFMEELVTGDF